MSQFSEWLESQIEGIQPSRNAAAAKIGISPATLSDLIKGKVKPDYETCLKLARFFKEPHKKIVELGGHEYIEPEPLVNIEIANPKLRVFMNMLAGRSERDQEMIADMIASVIDREDERTRGSRRNRRNDNEQEGNRKD